MSIHREISLENDVCADLAQRGWVHEPGRNGLYLPRLGLIPEDAAAWVEATNPQAWSRILSCYGGSGAEAETRARAVEAVAKRLSDEIARRGVLDVLREGFDMARVKGRIRMLGRAPMGVQSAEIVRAHEANICRVIRQVQFCDQTKESVDLALFVNGLPTATAELKTDFTQSVLDAIEQYRLTRNPAQKGRIAHLFGFKRGALVHFAVSNEEVFMTTRLEGKNTMFVPFNKGAGTGKGNPPNPHGHKTDYLWREVWSRESWLGILAQVISVERLDGSRAAPVTKIVFPRYHQLDAVRRLTADVALRGPGHSYLFQHSAGSGKTKTIAWSAHALAAMRDPSGDRIFDGVIVVSDRSVIDEQLRRDVLALEQKEERGLVSAIDGEGASKTVELRAAIAAGRRILVVTLQTFPHALSVIEEQGLTAGKRFAIIADEAHSSQTGKTTSALREGLGSAISIDGDEDEVLDAAEILEARQAARAQERGRITFCAFTATPKAKTMTLFGEDDPESPGRKRPFHLYAMRQAIEEGFILNVLQNYVCYKSWARVANSGQDVEVSRNHARKDLWQWVDLHPHNLAQKAEIVVMHFVTNVQHRLGGSAKAMVVAESRHMAVRWKKAIEDAARRLNKKVRALVAFSGEVDVDNLKGSEANPAINPDLKGRSIQDAFAEPDFEVLVVANKFQTGFDQPLLSAMYIDRQLSGVQAVQTLSRLNRCYPGKSVRDVFVLDFQDNAEEILKAFKTYYEEAELAEPMNPDLVFDVATRIDDMRFFSEAEVESVVEAVMAIGASQDLVNAALDPVVTRILDMRDQADRARARALNMGDVAGEALARRDLEAIDTFKKEVGRFLMIYGLMSQMIDYGDARLAKIEIFLELLVRRLRFGRIPRPNVDTSGLLLTHHRIEKIDGFDMLLGKGGPLEPIAGGEKGAGQSSIEAALMSAVVKEVNGLFPHATDADLVGKITAIAQMIMSDAGMRSSVMANELDQFSRSNAAREILEDAVLDHLARSEHNSRSLKNDETRGQFIDALLKSGYIYHVVKSAVAAERPTNIV